MSINRQSVSRTVRHPEAGQPAMPYEQRVVIDALNGKVKAQTEMSRFLDPALSVHNNLYIAYLCDIRPDILKPGGALNPEPVYALKASFTVNRAWNRDPGALWVVARCLHQLDHEHNKDIVNEVIKRKPELTGATATHKSAKVEKLASFLELDAALGGCSDAAGRVRDFTYAYQRGTARPVYRHMIAAFQDVSMDIGVDLLERGKQRQLNASMTQLAAKSPHHARKMGVFIDSEAFKTVHEKGLSDNESAIIRQAAHARVTLAIL